MKLGLDASEVEDLWKKDWKGQGFACRTWRTRDTIFFFNFSFADRIHAVEKMYNEMDD